MHPADAVDLEWDDWNEAELAAHGVESWEVVEVFYNQPVWVPNRRHRAGDWKMVGWTDAGRALTIIVRTRPETASLYLITGWDATAGDRTRYLRKRRRP